MRGRDEEPATIQVVVLEARRLVRHALSSWLEEQPDVELVGTCDDVASLEQLCDRGRADVAVIGISGEDDALLADVATIARRYTKVRLVGVLSDACTPEVGERLLGYGLRAVVPANAGSTNLLRVINAGSTVHHVPPPPSGLDVGPLTPREAQVLSLVGRGSTTYDISEQLGISRSTVANHKERIFVKLGANNQAHAVARAVKLGIIAPRREEDPLRAG